MARKPSVYAALSYLHKPLRTVGDAGPYTKFLNCVVINCNFKELYKTDTICLTFRSVYDMIFVLLMERLCIYGKGYYL